MTSLAYHGHARSCPGTGKQLFPLPDVQLMFLNWNCVSTSQLTGKHTKLQTDELIPHQFLFIIKYHSRDMVEL